MPSSLCMLAYHLYTLSKPVSPNMCVSLKADCKGTTNFMPTKQFEPIFYQKNLF